MHEVRLVRADETRLPAETTPGMDRREAFADEGVWMGTVRTDAGILTGWHHHGDHETYIHVLAGEARIEYGPGGRRGADLGPGDSIFIGRGVVHREGTSDGSRGAEAVLFRVGHGRVVVNVDGPAPDEPD